MNVSLIWSKLPRSIRFLFVGGVNTVFGYSCYAALLYIGLHYALAAFFGTILSVAFNYLTTSRFVFEADLVSIGRSLRFVLAYSLHYLINVSGLWVLEQLGLNPYVSGLIMIFPMAAIAYTLMKFLVYNTEAAGNKSAVQGRTRV